MSLSGLSEREAEASRQKYGLNERTAETSFAENIFGGLMSLSCKLFAIAAMVKIVALLLGLLEVTKPVTDVLSIFVLAGLALLCAFLEAVTRYISAKRMMEISASALQSSYTVLRGGKPESVEEKMLAVGDVVYLSAGDVVPADGIVADGRFIVDQSEFGTLEKAEKTTPPSGFNANRAMGLKSAYSLYKGSVITAGGGAMKITATGDNTIAAGKVKNEIKIHGSNFSSLTRAGGIIGAVCAGGVLIFCAVYGAIMKQPVTGILEGASAAAAVLAVTCLCGKNLIVEAVAAAVMRKLEHQGVRISKPDVLNDMQEISVLFTDKAGTFTDGDYVVSGFIDGTGNQIEKLEDVNEKVVALIRTAAINTSSAQLDSDNTVYGGTPADRAILNYIKKVSGKTKVRKQTFVCRGAVSGATVNLDGKLVTFFSGAAEQIISRCSDCFSADGKKRKITNKDALIKLAATISLTGNDVVALAVCDKVIKDEKLPNGAYTLIGLMVLHDKLCEGSESALESLENSGIRTVIMTSASRETVIYSLKKTGRKSKGVILSSEQLAKMNDTELAKRFSDIRAVVNADISDKMRIVRAAAEQGIKTCVIGTAADNLHMLDETDAAIAANICPSGIRRISDATAENNGLSAAAMLHSGSVSFAKMCKLFTVARIMCTVLLAAAAVISIIGR